MVGRLSADGARVSDDPHEDLAGTAGSQTEHPLQRAHRFFQKATPVIREAGEVIERHGGIEGVRDKVVERAGEIVRQVDEAIADATAIEGEVIERAVEVAMPGAPKDDREHLRRRTRRSLHYVELGILVAAATYGALALQRRRR